MMTNGPFDHLSKVHWLRLDKLVKEVLWVVKGYMQAHKMNIKIINRLVFIML